MRVLIAALFFCMLVAPASAHSRHNSHHGARSHQQDQQWSWGSSKTETTMQAHDPRPGRWCGWWLRQHLGVEDRSYNLARNWSHWGTRAFGPGIGVVVVWSHHVAQIVGQAENGMWMMISGNDGHSVRTRPRSLSGAIALRQ